MSNKQNIVGPNIRKLRYHQGLSQDMLAARCAVHGWDLSRSTLSKIESQLRCVSDSEVLILSMALKVKLTDLYVSTVANVRRQKDGLPGDRP